MIKSNERVGLVLSGGGVKSLAHIGFIETLLDLGIRPEVVSGTSGGAIVGGLYAAGYDPSDMIEFFREIPMMGTDVFAFFSKAGVVDSDMYVDKFGRFYPEKYEQLKYKLTTTATNLLTGKLEYFSKGDLIRGIIASAAFPPYFSPMKIGNNYYADGGILNNFPVEALEYDCDYIIGSFVNPVDKVEYKDINTKLKLLKRIFRINMDSLSYDKFSRCNYVFIPEEIGDVPILDKRLIETAYEIGKKYAETKKKEIMKIFE